MYQNGIFCTLKVIKLGVGNVKWHIPIPYFSLFLILQSRGGAWALVPLAMPVTMVQPGFVNLGPKRGSEEAERGKGIGREIL